MTRCDEYRGKTLRYLDDDLQWQELSDFRRHLEACADCRTALGAELALSRLLHRSKPLYSAPPALRSNVSAAVMQHSTSKSARVGICLRGLHELERVLVDPVRRVSSIGVLALVVFVLGFLFTFIPSILRQLRAASFVETAVSAHRSYLDGRRVMGLTSSSPEIVTAWITDKLPFQFRLPNARSTPNNTPSYRLTGASIVNYRGNPIALVTYEKENQAISLLVASSKSAIVAGGNEVGFGDLIFHSRTENGFKVITWSNHGLSYALVSSVSGSDRESCLICHQGMADHNNFGSGR